MRDLEKPRGERRRRRLNEGLVHIHLALISQTQRVIVRKRRQRGLYFFGTFGDTVVLTYFSCSIFLIFINSTHIITVSNFWNQIST